MKKRELRFDKYTAEQREAFRLALARIRPYLSLKYIADQKLLNYQRLDAAVSGTITRSGLKYKVLDDYEIDIIRIVIDDFKLKLDSAIDG